MWAIRRASIPLKNRNIATSIPIAFSNNSNPPSRSSHYHINGNRDSAGGRNQAGSSFFSAGFHTGRRCFSSETSAGAAKISVVDGDKEEGFSELETPIGDSDDDDDDDDDDGDDSTVGRNGEENAKPVESQHVPNDDNADDVEAIIADIAEKETPAHWPCSVLFKAIIAAPTLSSVHAAIDRWVKEGNQLGKQEYTLSMLHLRRRRMFGKALCLSEWVEKNKSFIMYDRYYASRLDLIAKLHGLNKAEQYMEKLPKSFRDGAVYRTLLANAVAANDRAKAEKIFNTMRDSGFELTNFVYDQLLLLYARCDKKRIADVLVMMEKDGLKPTLFSYKILIDNKGYSNDIKGMDRVVETMKKQGIEPDITLLATLARHYVHTGRKGKAMAVLEKIERAASNNDKVKCWSCRFLLPLYATLGETDHVQRLWKLHESNAGSDLSLAAMAAWGKLKKVEKAEEVFNKLAKAKRVGSKHYSALLKIYAHQKMLTKGRELMMQMSDSGCPVDPSILDALIALYVEAGEVEKADSILHKAVEENKIRPMYDTYLAIMDRYAERGDVHNTEKTFYRMRQQAGYVSHRRQFQALITAYVNAKAPFYGVRERMMADNIFPDRALTVLLNQVDAFKETAVTELLD